MIDLHELRENPDAYQTACTQKGIKLDIRSFLEVDERLRALKTEVEGLRASQNAFSKEIAKISGAEKETKLAEMKDLAARLKDQGVALKTLEDEHRALWLRLPSIPLSKVPVGRDDSENVEIRKWGTIPEFKFKPLDHAELGRRLDIIDMERGAKIAGARNYFLKGDGARIVHTPLCRSRWMFCTSADISSWILRIS
jgi:seryl-tRNA synthetase